MKTILTKKQQAEWCARNITALEHRWSTRGYGSSRIMQRDACIGKATGCGYDRYGTALGNAIMALFPDELATLAKRHCKTAYADGTKKSEKFYGLFLGKQAYLDGGCGHRCMESVLNAIGFGLDYVGERAGSVFYNLRPVDKRERERLR